LNANAPVGTKTSFAAPWLNTVSSTYQKVKLNEPLMRIELTTSSLPRKCSTTELQRLIRFVVSNANRRSILFDQISG
jgi:hypothetical protein